MANDVPASDASHSSEEGAEREASLIEAARRQAFEREGKRASGPPGEPSGSAMGSIPHSVGRYRILRRISSGGMGTVYEAEQDSPRRPVAVKVVQAAAMSAHGLRRFEREIRLLARLQHPGIAQIFEAGVMESAAGPHPFFSMEFVAGDRLTKYAESKRLGVNQRLELVVRVCEAVQHAHLKGVIHRDLKPANILVDPSGQPKVLDFGVARATDAEISAASTHTACGEPVGTVPYMSPEQVAGDPDDLDTRSDVYSLGVVCYELLAGRPPYDVRGKSFPEALRIISQQEPARLGALDRSLRGDVETLVAKAMEKDRQNRYQSAAELAAEIHRYLRGEPIEARPVGRLGRLGRWCRREPRLASLTGVLIVLLVATAVGSMAAALWIVAARRGEQEALRRAEELSRRRARHLYAARMNLAVQAFRQNDSSTVLALLEMHRPAPGEEDLRRFEWHYLWKQLHRDICTLRGHRGPVESVAFSPDGRLVASGAADGTIFLWDVSTWSRRSALEGHAGAVHSVAFAPGGGLLASGGEDGLVRLWDVSTARQHKILRGHPGPVQCVAFGDHGRLLASGGGSVNRFSTRMEKQPGQVKIWDVTTGEERVRLAELPDPVIQLAFRPEGMQLIAAAWGGIAHDWEIPTGKPLNLIPKDLDGLMALAASGDGSKLALGGWKETVVVWDVLKKQAAATIQHPGVAALAFSPAGQLLATANRGDGCIRLWDARSGRSVDLLRGHTGAVRSMAFDPVENRLVSGGSDGTLKVWDLGRRYDSLRLKGHKGEINHLAFSPDGAKIATAGRDGTARLWDVSTGEELARFGGGEPSLESVAFFPDGKRLAFCHWIRVHAVDLESQKQTVLGWGPGFLHAVAISPDGRFLAAGGVKGKLPNGRSLKVFATGDWRLQWAHRSDGWEVQSGAFSPDGRLLAVGGADGSVRLFDAVTGTPQRTIRHVGSIGSLAFSGDGALLAIGSWPINQPVDEPVEVHLWDPATGQVRFTLRGHPGAAYSVAFSPDGTTLATGGGNGVVRLWDLGTGDVRAALEMPYRGWVFGLAFSPDGDTLACSSGTTTEPSEVVLFDASSKPEVPRHVQGRP